MSLLHLHTWCLYVSDTSLSLSSSVGSVALCVQAGLKVFRVMKLQLITTWECCPRLSQNSLPSLAAAVTSNRGPVVEGPYLKVTAEGPSDQYYPPSSTFSHITLKRLIPRRVVKMPWCKAYIINVSSLFLRIYLTFYSTVPSDFWLITRQIR